MDAAQEHGGIGRYLVAYVGMLVITGIETMIAYRHPSGTELLVSLLILAFIGAALGVLYFMRLASENRPLIVGFTFFTLFVLAAMTYGWTDSFRLITGAPFSK